MKVNFSKINFGSLIQTKVYVDGNPVSGKEADEITNLLCQVLRKDNKGGGKAPLGGQQRDVFEKNVYDYKSIKTEDIFYNRAKTPKANVTSVSIEGLGSGRFLATGADIQKVARANENLRFNTVHGRGIVRENYYYQEHPEERKKALIISDKRAWNNFQDVLRSLFWTQKPEKMLEIRVKTAGSPKKMEKPEQLSIWTMENAAKASAKEDGKNKQSPLYKRYEIESLEFMPETLVKQA